MDRIDLLIIIFILSAVYRGARAGIFKLALSTVGFIVGLILGSQLALILLSRTSASIEKLFLTVIIELSCALILSTIGEIIGQKFNMKFIEFHLNIVSEVFGSLFEIAAVIFIIWIVTPSVSNIQAGNIGYYVQKSYIVRLIASILPAPPDYIARLSELISPNQYPNVFIGLEPTHTTVAANNKVNQQLVLNDEPSVVEIIGNGCGGTVEGSGFVVSPGIVVTNAHVIAGISSPSVIDQLGKYRARPILFDPNLDLAILAVNGLKDKPLKLASQNLSSGSSAVTLGYPGGGPLEANGAIIIDQLDAVGRNIYNQGQVTRNIYEIQSNVEPGNSGGPLIGPNGEVNGIVFAKSVTQNDVGYVLLINQLVSSINQAESHQTPVSDGTCTTY